MIQYVRYSRPALQQLVVQKSELSKVSSAINLQRHVLKLPALCFCVSTREKPYVVILNAETKEHGSLVWTVLQFDDLHHSQHVAVPLRGSCGVHDMQNDVANALYLGYLI